MSTYQTCARSWGQSPAWGEQKQARTLTGSRDRRATRRGREQTWSGEPRTAELREDRVWIPGGRTSIYSSKRRKRGTHPVRAWGPGLARASKEFGTSHPGKEKKHWRSTVNLRWASDQHGFHGQTLSKLEREKENVREQVRGEKEKRSRDYGVVCAKQRLLITAGNQKQGNLRRKSDTGAVPLKGCLSTAPLFLLICLLATMR